MSQPVLQTVQAINYQDHMSEVQHKQMKEQLKNNPKVLETKADAKEGGDDRTLTSAYDRSKVTSGLEAKKASLEKQKEIAHIRAAFHGAKGATMLAVAQSMPDAKKLVEDCAKHVENTVGIKEYHEVLTFALNPFENKPSIDELFENDSQWKKMKKESDDNNPEEASYPVLDICWGGFREANLVLNQDAKQAAIAVAVQAGAEMGTNLLTGNILDKQAKQLGEIIDEVGKFRPEDNFTSKVDELDCEKTPGHPFCIKQRAAKTENSGFLEGQYSFGDENLATTIGGPVEQGKNATKEGGGDSKTTSAGKVGGIVDTSSSKGKGGFGSYIPRGKVKRGRSKIGGGMGGSAGRVRAPGGGRQGRGRTRGGPVEEVAMENRSMWPTREEERANTPGGEDDPVNPHRQARTLLPICLKKDKKRKGKKYLEFSRYCRQKRQKGYHLENDFPSLPRGGEEKTPAQIRIRQITVFE